jgi:hypothetical protein
MSTACDSVEGFWGEIAPCEHLVQIYEDSGGFFDSLEGFVAGGLRSGDGILVIATPAHLAALTERLSSNGFDLDAARASDQFIALDAEETISRFMVALWPDEELFAGLVTDLLARAGANGRRKVRAFGEMVAVLWAQGYYEATMHLERLWHELCLKKSFSLFCAYPKSGFTKDAEASIREICEMHSRLVVN